MLERGHRGWSPLYWPIDTLISAFRRRALSPREVLEEAIARAERFDPILNTYLQRLDDAARTQARAAEKSYLDGDAGPLCGVPVSIKDTFPLAGSVTTFGSALFRDNATDEDSGQVRRLRAAGAVFTGKTNTAEFGQSATTDNRLGDGARNPWDIERTPGGSTGGGAATVAAGLACAAVGVDGGGSIRIPAAFTGLFGIKPSHGLCADEGGFRAMSDFACPGPLTWRARDARIVLGVMAGTDYARAATPRPLRIAWCAAPEGRPVDPGVARAMTEAREALSGLRHDLIDTALPLAGWNDAFGPLVLAEEGRERGDLLDSDGAALTDYERTSLIAAREVGDDAITRARSAHDAYRARIDILFEDHDALITPTTAAPAFRLAERPETIAGQRVDKLWGAFPFAVPFNVSGHPAASLPCGLADGLPVGLQIVGRRNGEGALLDLAEDFEEALAFDPSAVWSAWAQDAYPIRALR
jgi:Asp-tRNA(Asn)/Glu-tRNA(Gln) amidotransferase A subunit family amidase